jgi:cytochrome b6-f complex iron-sulfur subunit
MGDDDRLPDRPPTFDPRATPLPRRQVLMLIGAGAGALAVGGGLSVLLEACSSQPVTVKLDVDPSSLVPDTPVEVPFTMTPSGGTAVAGSTWLVKHTDGSLIAFDPHCTHAQCRYAWSASASRFNCACHAGQFALDGTVLSGPPPRPLSQFPVRTVGNSVVIDVPASFQTPKQSLPA